MVVMVTSSTSIIQSMKERINFKTQMNVKHIQPYIKDGIQSKQHIYTRHDVYKVINNVMGTALKRPVGLNA